VNYLVRTLIAFDELFNVVFGGYLDETLSSRAGRAAFHGELWGIILSWMLAKIVPNHCRLAELHDRQRAEYIVWLENHSNPMARMVKEMLVR
jgi:hypothetical protein